MSLEKTVDNSIIKSKEIVYIGWRNIGIGYKLFIDNWLSV